MRYKLIGLSVLYKEVVTEGVSGRMEKGATTGQICI